MIHPTFPCLEWLTIREGGVARHPIRIPWDAQTISTIPFVLLAAIWLAGCTWLELPGDSIQTPGNVVVDPSKKGSGYWPRQSVPAAYRRIAMNVPGQDHHGRSAHRITIASLSGIAARAVNEGRHDELIWMETNSDHYDRWREETLGVHPLEERETLSLFDLLRHYVRLGLVDGYILYKGDTSEGPHYEFREGMNLSINAATMIAAAQGNAVLIEESQMAFARNLGLNMILDTREMTEADAHRAVADDLSRQALLTIDPRVYQLRDMAIAHGLPVVYGTGDFFHKLLEWVEPNSLVLGWNAGDEGEHTAPPSAWGLVQTASNWSINLPFLSMGLEDWSLEVLKLPSPPSSREPETGVSYMAFQLSDGDNLQYMMASFFDSDDFWDSSLRGRVPVGWTICGAHLSQAAPSVLSYLSRTTTTADSFAEFSGGYFYPDLFAGNRGSDARREVLELHARMLAHRMRKTGTRVLTFICKDINSDGAWEAYQIFAENIPDLLGMIAVQYYPYNQGRGEVFWVENPMGEMIPILTPRFAIWENARWHGAGTPARVARLKNELIADQANSQEGPTFSLVAVHNWSMFRYTSNGDENAQNITREERESMAQPQGHRGLHAVKMTIDGLDDGIVVVTPEEMIRLIREHRVNSLENDRE